MGRDDSRLEMEGIPCCNYNILVHDTSQIHFLVTFSHLKCYLQFQLLGRFDCLFLLLTGLLEMVLAEEDQQPCLKCRSMSLFNVAGIYSLIYDSMECRVRGLWDNWLMIAQCRFCLHLPALV